MPVADAPRILGFIYGLFVVFLIPFLLMRDRFTFPVRILLVSCSVLSGILLFAPMTPLMFMAGLYRLREFNLPLLLVIGSFSFFIIAAGIFGRSFCGFACPVGAVQELPYYVPVRKWILRQSPLLLLLRAILICVFIALALLAVLYLFAINLMLMRGVRDVFYLSGTGIPAILFLALIGLSAVLYRPFCRFACPYGALISLAAWRSMMKVERTPACTDCKACEKVCPTGETERRRRGSECYLCGRCLDVCPEEGALRYQRRQTSAEIRNERQKG